MRLLAVESESNNFCRAGKPPCRQRGPVSVVLIEQSVPLAVEGGDERFYNEQCSGCSLPVFT